MCFCYLGLSAPEQLSAAVPAFRYKCEAFIETNKNNYERDNCCVSFALDFFITFFIRKCKAFTEGNKKTNMHEVKKVKEDSRFRRKDMQ